MSCLHVGGFVRTGLLSLALALAFSAASSFAAPAAWATPLAIKMTVRTRSIFSTERTFTVWRKGANLRVEGVFPVYGAFAKVPHVELYTDAGAFLYVPSLAAALHELIPLGQQRGSVTYPAKVAKELFEAPRDVLSRELKQPARVEGEEKVAGRSCFVLTLSDPKDAGTKEKRWIDRQYGVVLKSQQARSGKLESEFEATDAAFTDLADPALFVVPKDVKVISGTISPAALEKLRELGDQAKYEAAVRSAAAQADKQSPPWVTVLTPPAGLGHALTSCRSALGAVWPGQPGTGTNLPVVPGGPAVQLEDGSVLLRSEGTDENGNRFSVVAITTDPASGSNISLGEIRVEVKDGSATVHGPGGKELTVPLPNKGGGGAGQQGRAGMSVRPGDGMFVSEFVDPASGHTLVFYQSKVSDPTLTIAPKQMLGTQDKVTVGDREGLAYHADKPYARDVVAWRSGGIWYALSASGISREELLKAAGTIRAPK